MNDPQEQLSSRLGWLWKHASGLVAVLLILVAFVVGLSLGGGGSDDAQSPGTASTAETWTCSMHPQIRQPRPGKCPICAMDLIRLTDSQAAGHPRQLTVSPEAAALMNLQATPGQRRPIDSNDRLGC